MHQPSRASTSAESTSAPGIARGPRRLGDASFARQPGHLEKWSLARQEAIAGYRATLPFGVLAELDAEEGRLTVLEPALVD